MWRLAQSTAIGAEWQKKNTHVLNCDEKCDIHEMCELKSFSDFARVWPVRRGRPVSGVSCEGQKGCVRTAVRVSGEGGQVVAGANQIAKKRKCQEIHGTITFITYNVTA